MSPSDPVGGTLVEGVAGPDGALIAPAGGSGHWPAVVAIVGPTASGKTELALAVAERIGGEVVNADAYQVYRGMDIGTAKATAQQRARVRHHLLDILEVTEELTVAEFQRRGRRCLADIAARGSPAVVAGGSGLYVRALLDDLRFPGSDPAVRARWEAVLDEVGSAALHRILAARDPVAASRILPSNGRRIVRALEVGELTGAGFNAELPPAGPTLVPHVAIGLAIGRADLDARISARVERMFAEGLVEEVRRLMAHGLERGRTASRALGYSQVIDLIEGRLDSRRAAEDIVLATRRLARRQQRWFRRDPRISWMDASSEPSSTAGAIASQLSAATSTLGA